MKDITLTFAAICQVANLVQSVSRTGKVDEQQLNILLNSIIQTSPENTLAVYGGKLANIREGLESLVDHLDNQNKTKDPEFTRYIIGLINLERRLIKAPEKLKQLASRIEDTERQLQHYELTSEPLLASFASIYSDIISPLGARIQVAGDPTLLKQTANQHKIRALLLAGIRSTVLWRQVGGKRRGILLGRKKLVACAKQLLDQIKDEQFA